MAEIALPRTFIRAHVCGHQSKQVVYSVSGERAEGQASAIFGQPCRGCGGDVPEGFRFVGETKEAFLRRTRPSVYVFFGAELAPSVDEQFPNIQEAADFAVKYTPEEYPDARVVLAGPDGQLSQHTQEAALLRAKARRWRARADEEARAAREAAIAHARSNGDGDPSVWSWMGAGDKLVEDANVAEAEAAQHDEAAAGRATGAACPFDDEQVCWWCEREARQ